MDTIMSADKSNPECASARSSAASQAPQPRPVAAFLYAAPIGVLGGLMGLGGAEFRLPVLAGPLGYSARQAAPLNLLVSLVTLFASLVIRGRKLSFVGLAPFAPGIIAMIFGAMIAAFLGVSLAGRVSDKRLEQIILVLLVIIGCLLIVEAFLPQEFPAILPLSSAWQISAGVLLGLIIGLVSSLLGVAGGELIIPTMVFVYGCEIKSAGTASLIVSLPMVLVGVLHYARRGAFSGQRTLSGTVLPMGLGSIVGAVVGGVLVNIIQASLLKMLLGVILIVSAIRIFRHRRSI